MRALELIDRWPVSAAAAGVVDERGARAVHGALDRSFRLASVSKLITAWATLIAVEDGSVGLDEPAGPEGATVRHLLAHASGLPFDGPRPVAPVGRSRLYSNTGYEVLAAHVTERTGLPFDVYVTEAIAEPLGMTSLDPSGSPAKDFRCTVGDLLSFAAEMLTPTLLAAETISQATTAQFASLDGVLPGVGKFSPNPWGLGPELRSSKRPHWTGTLNSPRTFGHFGGSGTFVWVDPREGLACVALANRDFTEWGLQHWPSFSDAVLGEHHFIHWGDAKGAEGSP